MSSVSNKKKIQHLYSRAGFGISVSNLEKLKDNSLDNLVSKIFNDTKQFTELKIDHGNGNMTAMSKEERQAMTKEQKKEVRKQSRQNVQTLNLKWIDKMVSEPGFLREKMTLFWHGHFACRDGNSVFNENQNNVFRKNALGKFSDLLFAVSKDAEMLAFLNNQQNKKGSPNENFAREVMELFTLGRGNYTENDIKNAARAFTGWAYDQDGTFVFRKRQHDEDSKVFLGRSGNFNGDDILNIILENRKTSDFITTKLYKFFVNEAVPENNRIKDLSKNFYNSGYDIQKLLSEIFTSDWFYDEKNIGANIKSPTELVVGLIKNFKITFKNEKPILAIQKNLGQVLLYPPNVAGWSGGKNWIDTSTMMLRMKLPEILFKSSELEFEYNEDPQEMGEIMSKLKPKDKALYKQVRTSIDLKDQILMLSEKDNNEILDILSDSILSKKPSNATLEAVKKYLDTSSKENFIESSIMRLLSVPEYQLS
ncbi:DUF1800 domain-containing protein [soil metagenome]